MLRAILAVGGDMRAFRGLEVSLSTAALLLVACGESEHAGGGACGSANGSSGGSGGSGGTGGTGGYGAAWFEVLEPLFTPIVERADDPELVQHETLILDASADGTVLVGQSWVLVMGPTVEFASEAFRFTREGGVESLGYVSDEVPDQAYVFPRRVSRDGSVVFGSYGPGVYGPYFRWTETGGMVALATGDAGSFQFSDMSDDGSVVVGTQANEAARWTERDGFVRLGFLPGANASMGLRTSGDGRALFSGSADAVGNLIRWTEDEGMVALGPSSCSLPPGSVSHDGASVVAQCRGADGAEAFVWTEADGALSLGALSAPETSFEAMAASTENEVLVAQGRTGREDFQGYRVDESSGIVASGSMPGLPTCVLLPGDFSGDFLERSPASRDASVVAGTCLTTSGTAEDRAFRWTETTGLVVLEPLAGHVATRATSVSPDGIVGGISIGEAGEDEAVIRDERGAPESVRGLLDAGGVDVGGFWLDDDLLVVERGRIVYGLGHDATGARRAWVARLP
jgi:hypothetical protein